MKLRKIAFLIVVFALMLPATQHVFGMNWTQINTDGFGDANNQRLNISFFNQKMYVATGRTSDEGVGVAPIKVLEYDGSTWQQVNVDDFGDPNNLRPSGMVVFQNRLYAGTKNETTGAQIWSYDGSTWMVKSWIQSALQPSEKIIRQVVKTAEAEVVASSPRYKLLRPFRLSEEPLTPKGRIEAFWDNILRPSQYSFLG